MSTQLSKLQIDEVSGVDDPANMLPGWLLTKSRAELETVVVDVADAHNGLLKSLETADKYFADAPQDVQAAASTLKSHVEKLADTDDDKRSFIGRALSYFKTKDEIDMKPEELEATLAAHTEALTKAVAETIGDAVTKAVEAAAPAEVEAPIVEKVETEEVAKTITAEEFATLAERVETLAEVVGKSVDAITTILEKSAQRNALDGQEDEVEVDKSKNKQPSLGDAFARAMRGEQVNIT